ncbi:MAG TPA: riboflavin synthase [Xanthomonadaceae bacterium]|jgi:riboflavin synthase|nr:riboflavin synthase [Xanthomonadaceae bacterium]
MFTGLIQAVGRLVERTPVGGDLRLRFAVGALPFDDVLMGESIACNGVCLTVVAFAAGAPPGSGSDAWFDADVSTETLALTTLGALAVGAAVNLERALRVGDRLGGHLVSGHVDGIGAVESIVDDARGQRWRFSAPKPLLRFIAPKGSIAVDGTSLTVNAADDAGFEVMLVPHTLAHTGFGTMAVGTRVNLEIDTVARYVARLQDTEHWA